MNVWIVWVLAALAGASAARFIHADKLTDGLRERWEVHWEARIEQALLKSDALLNIAGLARGERDPQKMGRLRQEMLDRASQEPGVPLWTRRAQRVKLRPWSTRVAEISRLSAMLEFPGCRSCLPFWVFLPLFALITLGWAFGFSVTEAVAMSSTVEVPASYAVFVVVVELPLAARWLYFLADKAVHRD